MNLNHLTVLESLNDLLTSIHQWIWSPWFFNHGYQRSATAVASRQDLAAVAQAFAKLERPNEVFGTVTWHSRGHGGCPGVGWWGNLWENTGIWT